LKAIKEEKKTQISIKFGANLRLYPPFKPNGFFHLFKKNSHPLYDQTGETRAAFSLLCEYLLIKCAYFGDLCGFLEGEERLGRGWKPVS